MNRRPPMILHPGLPKCASSSIQRMFVLDDHAVGKALDVDVIGRNFQVGNGYPDVSKLMYEPETVKNELRKGDFLPDRTHFLSNEALSSNADFLDELARRFEIKRVIFSVRFPPLQAISNFAYSGWLRSGFSDFSAGKATSPHRAINRVRSHLDRFRAYSDDIRVCPVEGISAPLEKRFLKIGFDRIPDILDRPPFCKREMSNVSISPAFAEALSLEVLAGGVRVSGPDRNAVVKKAQSHVLPEDLARLTIPEIGNLSGGNFDDSLSGYFHLLREFRLSSEGLEEAESVVRLNIEKLVTAEVASQVQMDELRKHARAVLAHVMPEKIV